VLFKKLIIARRVQKSSTFMETEHSLQCSYVLFLDGLVNGAFNSLDSTALNDVKVTYRCKLNTEISD
jgi:hypothetical protein